MEVQLLMTYQVIFYAKVSYVLNVGNLVWPVARSTAIEKIQSRLTGISELRRLKQIQLFGCILILDFFLYNFFGLATWNEGD